MKFPTLLMASALAFSLTACATAGGIPREQAESQALQAYRDAAGEPVSQFNLVNRSLHSWVSFGTEQLVLYTTPSRAFLVQVTPCPGLDYAQAIRVTDSLGQVQRNFSKVYALDNSPISEIGCPITSIQPINMEKFRQLQAPFRNARPE